jgi:hypothetical protein
LARWAKRRSGTTWIDSLPANPVAVDECDTGSIFGSQSNRPAPQRRSPHHGKSSSEETGRQNSSETRRETRREGSSETGRQESCGETRSGQETSGQEGCGETRSEDSREARRQEASGQARRQEDGHRREQGDQEEVGPEEEAGTGRRGSGARADPGTGSGDPGRLAPDPAPDVSAAGFPRGKGELRLTLYRFPENVAEEPGHGRGSAGGLGLTANERRG